MSSKFKNGMRPVHPGEILKEEYLSQLCISANDFSKKIGVTAARIYEIISEKRGITADTALRFASALNTSPQYWMNLQTAYDLRQYFLKNGDEALSHITPINKNGS